MKQKFISLGLAAALLLSVSGCARTTPQSVGSIGGVDIPAGIYLLTQYNAYSTASNGAELATGESALDVDAVLRAETSGQIGGEEVTANGADYIRQLTQYELGYYAAVEKKFAELGGTLDEEALAAARDQADAMWENGGELYTANGIGQETLRLYTENRAKADEIVELLYGPQGEEPVTDAAYEAFIEDDCRYVESIEMPLVNYSTYSMADDEQKSAVQEVADDCVKALAAATPEDAAAASELLQETAEEYLPKAFEALDSTLAETEMPYYVASSLYLPATLDSYNDGNGGNSLRDPLDEADGDWTSIDLGFSQLVARSIDPFAYHTLDEFKTSYDLLDAMKGDDVTAELYAEGAALDVDLDENAMRIYSASKIVRRL